MVCGLKGVTVEVKKWGADNISSTHTSNQGLMQRSCSDKLKPLVSLRSSQITIFPIAVSGYSGRMKSRGRSPWIGMAKTRLRVYWALTSCSLSEDTK